jgi:hypothetical protein
MPKDLEVRLGVVGDVFFSIFPKSWIGRLFWKLLEMLLVTNSWGRPNAKSFRKLRTKFNVAIFLLTC